MVLKVFSNLSGSVILNDSVILKQGGQLVKGSKFYGQSLSLEDPCSGEDVVSGRE